MLTFGDEFEFFDSVELNVGAQADRAR